MSKVAIARQISGRAIALSVYCVRSEVGSAGVPARKLKGRAIRMRGLALDKRPLSLLYNTLLRAGTPALPTAHGARVVDCRRPDR